MEETWGWRGHGDGSGQRYGRTWVWMGHGYVGDNDM